MKRFIASIIFGLVITYSLPNCAQSQSHNVMIITGNVKDSMTDNPISGAAISSNTDVSPVFTDQNGSFRFIIISSAPISIKVNKEGYNIYEKVLMPLAKTDLNIKLNPQTSRIGVGMIAFQRNISISGKIDGIPPNEYSNYKVLIYVLTNKWYIHPWAENVEGKGFASIANDGTWKIGTVWRGYQAYRVAFLLTKRSAYSPPTVEVISDNPDQDLLAKINPIAHSIIEAPSGI
jgi:hypothetical protein